MKRIFPILFFCFICASSFAQSLNIPVDSWREHLPVSKGISIAQSNEKVFCATEKGIIVLRKDDNSFEVLGRSGGLSDINIGSVGFHDQTQTLLIGYKNGNIDLLRNNEVANLGDLKRSNVISGAKAINRVKFKENLAYLCTSFGVVVIDMVRREVSSTLYPTANNAEVFDIDFKGDSVFVATEQGIRKADLTDPAVSFFNNWTTLAGFDATRPTRNVTWYNNELYITRYVPFEYARDTIFRFNNGSPVIEFTGNGYPGIRESKGQLLVCENLSVLVKKSPTEAFQTIFEYNNNGTPNPSDAIRDNQEDRVIWIADQKLGLVKSFAIFDNQPFTPEGPASKNVFRLQVAEDQLWVATGGYDFGYAPLYQIDGLFNRDGAIWNSYQYPTATDWVRDIVGVTIDPANSKHLFASTWGSGIVEVDNGVIVQKYDTTNSELYPIAENSGEIRVSAVAFDKDAKLWAVSTSATRPVAMRKPDGTWKSYGFNSAINDQSTSDMLIDSSGQKWFIVQDRGLVVFKTDEEDELESFQLINDQIGSGALNSTRVFSMAQDLDGLIWVGTSKGVNVIYSPDAILDENNQSNWDAQKITVSQGGFNQYLLNSEEVTAIVVDGANRKWFGTKSAGLFLVSPDGTEQIANYDFENSPLLSNTIISMAMNYKTGELFIGTDQGICSFRTDASMSDRGFDKMYAFPNPVRPDYTGLITVTGLVNNADVKITDVEGNVVFAGVSNGGTITWNGRLYSGERAATGVYMIFAANEDGSETKVTKLLFVN
jgi:ligand-binding sensor domain-containing protein